MFIWHYIDIGIIYAHFQYHLNAGTIHTNCQMNIFPISAWYYLHNIYSICLFNVKTILLRVITNKHWINAFKFNLVKMLIRFFISILWKHLIDIESTLIRHWPITLNFCKEYVRKQKITKIAHKISKIIKIICRIQEKQK